MLYVIVGSEVSMSLSSHGEIIPHVLILRTTDLSSRKTSRNFGLTEPRLNVNEISETTLDKNKKTLDNLRRSLKTILEKHAIDDRLIGGNMTLSYPLFQEIYRGIRSVDLSPKTCIFFMYSSGSLNKWNILI